VIEDLSVFKPRADVRFRVVGDEAVVVRQEASEVIALNDVGASVLSLLDSRRTVAAVVEALLSEYDVDRDSLREDVASFLTELRDAGVVEEVKA
jgi:hypothetical protein